MNVLTGGTDVHLVLCDLRESELDGQQAEDRLHEVGITVNRNAVPFDPRPPAVSSGLRIGTPALATRGLRARRLRRGRPDHRRGAAARRLRAPGGPSSPSGPRRSPSATRCTRVSAPPRWPDSRRLAVLALLGSQRRLAGGGVGAGQPAGAVAPVGAPSARRGRASARPEVERGRGRLGARSVAFDPGARRHHRQDPPGGRWTLAGRPGPRAPHGPPAGQRAARSAWSSRRPGRWSGCWR